MQRRYLTCTVPRSKNKYPPRSERPPQSKYPFKNRLAERPPSESAERPSFNSTHPSQNSRATFNSSGSKYPSSRANSNSNYPSQNTRAPFNSSESKYPSSRANSNSNYPPQQSRRELSPPFAHSESKYAYSSTRNFKSQHPSSDSVAERRPSFTSKSKYPSIDNHTKRPPVFEPFLGNRKQPQVLDAFRRNAIDNHQLQYEKPLDPERNPAREKKISRKTLKIAQTTSYKLLRDVAFSETIVEGNRGTRALKGIVERHEARAMMNDQKSFDIPNLGMADEELLDVSFAPGSFVEARRNEITVQGIVLTEAIIDRQWNLFTLKSNGEVYFHLRADVHFVIPNLVSAELAERCGSEIITHSPQELNARIETLRCLRDITLGAENAANGSNVAARHKNIDIYEFVRSQEPHKWSKTNLSEVTKLLYKEPTFLEYLGTHKFLMDNSLKYVADQSYIKTQTFNVRPIEHVEEIQTVLRWVKAYRRLEHAGGNYGRFIDKASTILKAYDEDKTRRDSGPMTSRPAKHNWTSSDKIILGFLLRSLQLQRSTQTNPYALGRSSILKHLYPNEEVTDSLTHKTLIKLGVLAPWQDLVVLLPEFDADLEPEETSERAKAEKALVEKSFSTAGQVLGSEDFHSTDPLESVRHDFSNERVFIIDDVHAEELDDGFSLERIPSEPDNHWIHVHIADPAHLLHPGHTLCQQARKRGSTLYFLQKSHPLFPKALMHHPTRGLSLGSDALNGLPNKVITFSIKVDGNANILDYNVRAGLIRNIKKTTYDSVDHALGLPPSAVRYPFGPPPEATPGSPISEEDLKDLRVLYRLANDQVQRRFREDRISFTMENAKLARLSFDPNIRSPTMIPSVFNGFPEMIYSVGGSIVDDIHSRSLVSEMMKLACRVASRFALDHNIPFLRRGTDAIMASTEAAYAEILAQRSPHGYVPLHTNLERIAITPPAAFSLTPRQHHPLAIPEGEGYSRATSPLRRYDDLVQHWQLHHVLLGSKAPPRPPFDADALEKYIPELTAKDLGNRIGQSKNTGFFLLMFLSRWMDATAKGAERPFGDPLASMTAYTITMVQDNFMGSNGCHVHLPELGIKAQLVGLPGAARFPLSTELKVKAKRVDLGIQRPKFVVELL